MRTSKEVADGIVARIQQVVDARSRATMGGRLVSVDEVLVGRFRLHDLLTGSAVALKPRT
jgi:hypothetical protein